MTNFQMASSESTPEKLFEGKTYRIPDYQRGYAWESEQLNDFLEDLEVLPSGSTHRHYTGTIVLHRKDKKLQWDKHDKCYEVFEVVDGQQRLTTIVILLDAIRREFDDIGEIDIAQGVMNILTLIDPNGQKKPKLQLNKDCHDFFSESVLIVDGLSSIEASIRSHQNLRNAKEHFESFLREKRRSMGRDYLCWLKELKHKICNQLSISIYEIEKEADAGVIFEVMNNRGRPITQFEKVKNYLLYVSSKLDLRQGTDFTPHSERNVDGCF